MKRTLLLVTVVALVLAAPATIYATNWKTGLAKGVVVPDNNIKGWSDSRSVSMGSIGAFMGLSVDLELTGGWNGDLYAYVVHDGGFNVLLDRVGTPRLTDGYGDVGMNVTLAATGKSIHGHGGGNTFSSTPTGTWMMDNTSGSLALFSSASPNGTRSLFIADLSAGGVTTVRNWGLQRDIVAVPELETWIAAAVAGAFGAFWVSREVLGQKEVKHS